MHPVMWCVANALRRRLVAEKQYEDLCAGIKNSLPSEWECRFVPIILGRMSISEKVFGEAMEWVFQKQRARVCDKH